jgi:uncharacterized protein YndB with AHSA1/START domain
VIASSHRFGSAVITTPSDLEIRITRRFDAPTDRVFRAWTTPRYVRRWWGFESSPLVVCEIDLRIGGVWRYVTCDPDGAEMGWTGTFHEILPGRRLVSTEVFESSPERATLNTLELIESAGVTTLTINVLHSDRRFRDDHVGSGMERGLQHGLDRIERLVTDEPEPDPNTEEPTP